MKPVLALVVALAVLAGCAPGYIEPAPTVVYGSASPYWYGPDPAFSPGGYDPWWAYDAPFFYERPWGEREPYHAVIPPPPSYGAPHVGVAAPPPAHAWMSRHR